MHFEFCKSGHLPDFLMCTEKLQKWNQLSPKKVNVIPVVELSSQINELLNVDTDVHVLVSACYDSRPIRDHES